MATKKTTTTKTKGTKGTSAKGAKGAKGAKKQDAEPKALRQIESWTLAQAGEAFLARLTKEAASPSTLGAYKADLGIAIAVLGEKREVANINRSSIERFDEHELVTQTRSGKPKAIPTIERTRRVLRLVLRDAHAAGYIAELPFELRKKKGDPEAPKLTKKEPSAEPKRKPRAKPKSASKVAAEILGEGLLSDATAPERAAEEQASGEQTSQV